MNIKINRSKDTFCDYLLIKLWEDYITKDNLEPDLNKIKNTTLVDNFMLCLNQDELAQFGIKTIENMQNYLSLAYQNLQSNDVKF